MTHTLRLLALVLAAVLLSSCSTVKIGRDFDLTAFTARIERGVTTQIDVRNWLGAPESTGTSLGTDGQRYEEWGYFFAEGQLGDTSNARLKQLQIKFDTEGKVRGYSWSQSK